MLNFSNKITNRRVTLLQANLKAVYKVTQLIHLRCKRMTDKNDEYMIMMIE